VRPFIDARVELYGDGMLSLYDQLRSGDREPVEDALKRYDIAWTLFAPDNRVVAALDRKPGWGRLFVDATAVVHMRDTALGPKGLGEDRRHARGEAKKTWAQGAIAAMARASSQEAFEPPQGRAPRDTSSFSRSTPGPKWIAGMPSASEACTLAGESSMNRSSPGRRPARLNRIS
jgi:hypothetical protein